MCFLNMKNIRYTPESMNMIRYLLEGYYSPDSVDINGSRLLHYVCSFGETEYMDLRGAETGRNSPLDASVFREEFQRLQYELINYLKEMDMSSGFTNKKGETPLTLCI